MLDEVHAHQDAGRPAFIVSAAGNEVVGALAPVLGMEGGIGTSYEVDAEGRFTGRLDGPFVYGPGKVEAMEEFAAEHGIDLAASYAYSDSLSDLPMLRAVGNPVAVNPDPPLAALAKEEGWQVLRFERLGRRLVAVAVTVLATLAGFGASRVAARRRAAAAARRRPPAPPVSRRAWVAFAAVSLLWGIPYLFIKVAVDGGMPPLPLAWGRIVARRRRPPRRSPGGRGRCWRCAAAVAGSSPTRWPSWRSRSRCSASARSEVASSTAAIVIATAPLIVAVLALRFEPRRTARAAAASLGLLVGLAGVAALVGIDVTGSGGELLGVAGVFVAACGYATGPLILKRHLADLDPIASMGACLAIAARAS